MTRTALMIEIEALLFDTLDLRTEALLQALAAEGVTATYRDVARAHAGRPTALALRHVAVAARLDVVGRELVVRRADDAVAAAIASGAPSFDPHGRDALLSIAAEYPLAVVTTASSDGARQLLELAGLDACVATIRSIAEAAEEDQHLAWADAQRRTHADRGAAFAPTPLLAGAARAGLTTVSVGANPGAGGDAHLVSLAQLDASFVRTLFRPV